MLKKIKLILAFLFLILVFCNSKCLAFEFTCNTNLSTNTYNCPDIETIQSSYLQYLDNGYVIQRWGGLDNGYWSLIVLANSSSFFYSTKDGQVNISGSAYRWNLTNKNATEWSYCSPSLDSGTFGSILYYNADIYTDANKTDFYFKLTTPIVLPSILDTDDNLSLLNMSNLVIDTGNINIKEGFFDFLIRTKLLGSSDDFLIVYHAKLDKSSSFYKTGGINGDYYEIPVDTFKNLLTKGYLVSYDLMWLEEGKDASETVSRSIIFGYESTETNDILNNNFKNLFNLITKQALEETALSQKQHAESQETQKSILATIKEVVSYINPLSENFFVYKLIDLLIEALKNLFIPGDEFFSNYFNELKEWFSNRFGFLAYPLDLILDILNRILNINFTEPAFNIPEIKETITNTKLISATNFNFNILLENETLKTVHDTYLILVDAVIIFALINLAKTKFEEVMTK